MIGAESVNQRRGWTREETILAIELYSRTPFEKIHRSKNANILNLAQKIGRTPASVALKMWNFASIDPSIKHAGMGHHSKLDAEVWDEFFSNTGSFIEKAVKLANKFGLPVVDEKGGFDEAFGEGKEYVTTIKARVDQQRFRQMILASYNYRCAITGIHAPELLVASHIVPWKSNKRSRMDPRNGICLNALHDRAFDRGLITFNDDYKMVLSNKIRTENPHYFRSFEGKQILMPSRFRPLTDYIQFHRKNIFVF
ncbi:MAG: HNH endonuclease [Nitrospinae bacterium]|nr:HNH endonuclease [Nitrospinota bacterium]